MNTLALISNILSGDGLIIFLILLLLFGAKRLPELAKGLGSAVREFSKAKDEIEHEITRPAVPPPTQIEPPRDTQARTTPAQEQPSAENAASQERPHTTVL